MSDEMPTGCPFYNGPACPDCSGSCWEPAVVQPQPTGEEYCAGMGHPLYAHNGEIGLCWCGSVAYPDAPNPTASEVSP